MIENSQMKDAMIRRVQELTAKMQTAPDWRDALELSKLTEKLKVANSIKAQEGAQANAAPVTQTLANNANQAVAVNNMMGEHARSMQGQMFGTGGIVGFLRSPEPQAMAKGGAVAFSKGRRVYSNFEPESLYSYDYLDSGFPGFPNTPEYEELKRKQGLSGVLSKAASNIGEGISNKVTDIKDMLNAVPAEWERRKKRDLDYIGWYGSENQPSTPVQAPATPTAAQTAPAPAPQSVSRVQTEQQINQLARDAMAANNPQSHMGGAAGSPSAGAPVRETQPSVMTPPAAAASGISDLLKDARYGAEDLDMAKAVAARKALIGEDPSQKIMTDKLAEREARLAKEEERAPWMALMSAGLGMMSGTSPYALANIGAGGQQGLQSYINAQNKLEDKKDKVLDAQAKLAAAKRAEDVAIANSGISSVESKTAHNKTVSAKEAELKQQYDLKMKDIDMQDRYHQGYINTLNKAYGTKGSDYETTLGQLQAIADANPKDSRVAPFMTDGKFDPMKVHQAYASKIGATITPDQRIKMAQSMIASGEPNLVAQGTGIMNNMLGGTTTPAGAPAATPEKFDFRRFWNWAN